MRKSTTRDPASVKRGYASRISDKNLGAPAGSPALLWGTMEDRHRKATLLYIWFKRPPEKRTANDLLKFYGELQQNNPQLVKHGHGDPYEQLKVDLYGYVLEP